MATVDEHSRFLVSVPEGVREYRAIELWHPQFLRVQRFVKNYIDVTLPLESNAPRNAGEQVNFQAATVNIIEPSERQDGEQILQLNFGNVDGRIHDLIDSVTGQGYLTPIEVIYRKYVSTDLSQPAVPPVTLFASSIAFQGTSATFNAEDSDLSQKRSGGVYSLELFPGLAI